ncbi:hypothetical protein TSUD_289360 [Trifolium subterraneum]|uniref:Uncharacterized protein n=1 Tax=Trifolium subterraneum TaxID=3900 RepID=A0A2Z6M3V4_TRISU|nr:hypothetical protein TSUD_289360 [Trifolium subterraneum]
MVTWRRRSANDGVYMTKNGESSATPMVEQRLGQEEEDEFVLNQERVKLNRGGGSDGR